MGAVWTVLVLALGLVLACAARATTVVPPNFDELVHGSELIFRGRVKSVESQWRGDGAERRIATVVAFEVDATIKGEAPAVLTLEFIGGQIGRRRLEIVGLPQFAAGEHGVFFVERREGRICPIARLRHGRYRIVTPPGGDAPRVLRDDGTPLSGVVAVREPFHEVAAPARAAQVADAMTLAGFEAEIASRVAAAATAGGRRK